MEQEQEDLIQQFSSITNEDSDRSRFYLESANWNLDLAVGSFYDNSGGPEPEELPVVASASEQDVEFHDASEDVAETRGSGNATSGGGSRFHSLADYERTTANKDDDSDEEGQEFYAGGSEHSGEVIVGPGKKSAEDIVKKMFKNAQEHGAVPIEEARSSSSQKQGAKHFSGGGYKLGETSDDHQFIPAPQDPSAMQKRKLDVVLRLYKDGFTVGDGPLRQYHDSESRQFLGAVAKGEIPEELLRLAKGGEVNLDMEDHKHEEYKEQKKVLKPFTGEGHTLGSVTPTVVSNEAPSKPAETAAPSGPTVSVNENSPVTTIRIQMGDGSRVTQRFNHDHTVARVYSFVRDCNPGESRHFILMTTFPNKELIEDSTTLKEGSLLNAVIVQRFK